MDMDSIGGQIDFTVDTFVTKLEPKRINLSTKPVINVLFTCNVMTKKGFYDCLIALAKDRSGEGFIPVPSC